MKKQSILLFFLSISFLGAYANSTRDELAVSLIPDSLTKKANSIIREYDVTLDIESPSKAELTYHKIVTVMNDKAEGELSIVLFYNTFEKIGSMTAMVYDRNGKLMNKHNKSDMRDYAAADGYSLYQDERVKFIRVGGGEYPVTIDYTYTKEYKGIMDYPDWHIQQAHQSIEKASLHVTVPADLDINYKAYNIHIEPSRDKDKKDMLTYVWSVAGRKAITTPNSGYDSYNYLPHMDLSPRKFEMDGHQSSLSSWKDFGATFSGAYKARRQLTDKSLQAIHAMVKDARSDREKAEILYHYLQHNFRYVSIQIGFGGYVPFSAGSVDSTKYGDCKALSNYMCALLGAVGIKSYPTLINAGTNLHPIDTTFPSNKFNHCILYAEIDHSPTWLECTSSALPFGELGTFTENRYGLMLTDDGGKIVHTPVSNAGLNTMSVSSEISLTENTHANISSRLSLGGEFREGGKSQLMMGSKKEQERYLFNHLNLKQYENFELKNTTDTASIISADLKGETSSVFDFRTGAKAFLPASYIVKWYENITSDSTRRHEMIIGYPFTKSEKLTYIISDSNKVSLPADVDLEGDLLSFHRTCSKENDRKIVIETTLTKKKHILVPGEINQYKEAQQAINKYIQQKVIIEKM